jgi:hypothetical protein
MLFLKQYTNKPQEPVGATQFEKYIKVLKRLQVELSQLKKLGGEQATWASA